MKRDGMERIATIISHLFTANIHPPRVLLERDGGMQLVTSEGEQKVGLVEKMDH
jgi:hypothetical protein